MQKQKFIFFAKKAQKNIHNNSAAFVISFTKIKKIQKPKDNFFYFMVFFFFF